MDEDVVSEHDQNDRANYGPQRTADPYANLGGAFGSYLADAPQPMNAAGSRSRPEEDLLF